MSGWVPLGRALPGFSHRFPRVRRHNDCRPAPLCPLPHTCVPRAPCTSSQRPLGAADSPHGAAQRGRAVAAHGDGDAVRRRQEGRRGGRGVTGGERGELAAGVKGGRGEKASGAELGTLYEVQSQFRQLNGITNIDTDCGIPLINGS